MQDESNRAAQAAPKRLVGIEERHGRGCATADGGRCTCKGGPSFRAYVYDKRTGRNIKRTFSGRGAKSAAKGWRANAVSDLGRGKMSAPSARTFRAAAEEWLAKADAGTVRASGR